MIANSTLFSYFHLFSKNSICSAVILSTGSPDKKLMYQSVVNSIHSCSVNFGSQFNSFLALVISRLKS